LLKQRIAFVICHPALSTITKACLSFAVAWDIKLKWLNPVEQLWQQIKQRFLSNTTFQNYDDIIERSCQAWNEILSENGFIKNLLRWNLNKYQWFCKWDLFYIDNLNLLFINLLLMIQFYIPKTSLTLRLSIAVSGVQHDFHIRCSRGLTIQQRVSYMEQLTLPEHLSSHPLFSGVRSLVFCVIFCRLLFVLLFFFFCNCIICPSVIFGFILKI
jgi:hypothetical protein